MRWSFRVGTLFGIRVELHVTFLVYIAWMAIQNGLLTGDLRHAGSGVLLVLLLFTCVLLHELGHALTARRYGIATRDIILLPIGGVARLERMPEKPQQELLVALAGPAVNVVIATLLFAAMGGHVPPLGQALTGGALLPWLFGVNVFMILFNLIPAFPMDGGRVLRALLAFKMPYGRATAIASRVGQTFALLFGIAGLVVHSGLLMIIALFVFLAASEENAMVRNRTSLDGLPVHAAMVTDFHALEAADPLQRAVDFLMAGAQQDFPVLEAGAPIGMLTRADLVKALQQHGVQTHVGDVIHRDQEYADAGEPLDQAIQRMRSRARTALPVVHRGGLVGMLTLENVSDLLVVRDALRRHAGAHPA